MENSRSFSGNTVGNNATVNQNNVTHITVNTATSNADRSFLQEIGKTNPIHDKKDILMRKGPLLRESFHWILEYEDFSKWRHAEETGVFWIKGDAGKGKTMMLCGIIEEFEKDSQNTNLAYFFCQATDYRTNTAAAVIRGLIFSLLKRHTALLTRIRERYGDGPKEQLDGAKALAVLFDIFEAIVQDSDLTDLTCVVDALDECTKDCEHLLDFIIKTSSSIKWLLSSRNEKHIEKRLMAIPQTLVLELKQNAENVSASIEVYINHHIRKISALQGDEKLQFETLDILKTKASGTFLWVALVIEQLRDTNHWEIQDVLEEMPEGLGSIYGLIISRIDKLRKKAREACQVLLSIIVAAKRPLHLAELLVFINSHWKGSGDFKTSYQIRDIRDMTKDCGSILSIRDDTIYFIHQSAKDYIVETAAQHIFPIQHQHYKMFETSLVAMSSILTYDIYNLKDPAVHIDDIPQQSSGSDPLASIRYCCVFWVEHLVQACQFEGFEHWKYFKDDQRLHSFLREKFLCWAESMALMRTFVPHALFAFQKFKVVIESYCGSEGDLTSQSTKHQRERETICLRQFADDAYRFLIRSNECVGYWPLQLYFSAIGFEPSNSAIRKSFEQTVRDKFGPSPTVSNISQGQSSLLLRTLEFPDKQHGPTVCDYLFFSPDSVFLCALHSSSPGNSIRILTFWKTETGRFERSFQVKKGSKISFFPDSKHFISVSKDGVMKKWNVNNGSCIQEQTLGLGQDRNLVDINPCRLFRREEVIALSPNGDLVATLYYGPIESHKIGIRVWDTELARCGCAFTSDAIPFAAFSPNSELLALAYMDDITIHHTKTGQEIKNLRSSYWQRCPQYWSDTGRCPIFSRNSRILVAMRSTEKLCIWDTNTWSLLHQIEVSSTFRFLRLMQPAISPDSAILATSAQDGLKLWSIDSGKCIGRIPSSQHITFSPDWAKSSLVATQPNHNVIQIREADFDQNESEVQGHGGYYAFTNVVISPDSRFVASMHNHHGEISIYNGDNGQLIHILGGNCSNLASSYCLQAFSPDSELLAGLSGSDIRIWRVVTGESICLIKCSKKWIVTSIAFSADSQYLVAGNTEGNMLLWRIDSGQCEPKYSFGFGRMISISSVAISPNSTRVAAYYFDHRSKAAWLNIRHLNTGECITLRHRDRDYVQNWVIVRDWECLRGKITFSTDSAILASITAQDVLICDVSTGACLKRINVRRGKYLPSFDPISGQIFTDFIVFRKTSSWKVWETSPRLGYSNIVRHNGKGQGDWILLDGKRTFYIPTDFIPGSSLEDNDSAMSDSLLAVVSRSEGLVIIKFPTQRERPQQGTGNLNPRTGPSLHILGAGNSNLDVFVPVTDDSDSRNPKRRRLV